MRAIPARSRADPVIHGASRNERADRRLFQRTGPSRGACTLARGLQLVTWPVTPVPFSVDRAVMPSVATITLLRPPPRAGVNRRVRHGFSTIRARRPCDRGWRFRFRSSDLHISHIFLLPMRDFALPDGSLDSASDRCAFKNFKSVLVLAPHWYLPSGTDTIYLLSNLTSARFSMHPTLRHVIARISSLATADLARICIETWDPVGSTRPSLAGRG